MTTILHFDEARRAAIGIVTKQVASDPRVERAVVVDDLFGRLRVILRTTGADTSDLRDTLAAELERSCTGYWTGDIWERVPHMEDGTGALYDQAIQEAVPADDGDTKVWINDRHRNRTGWFLAVADQAPPWATSSGPPIVAFHSFKGGVGRTTALAAYAIARARRGDRVVVIDVDLDAPGIGRLLDSDAAGGSAPWGVVDFLLEAPLDLPLADYCHRCARPNVTGEGAVDVFPAGRLNDDYLSKLARTDLDVGASTRSHPLVRLLVRVRDEMRPAVILLDGRAGLSPAAGLLLGGLAHLSVLLSTSSEQSLIGLERVVHRMGYERARLGIEQASCLIVHSLVPDNAEVGERARAEFATRVEDIFRDHYLAAEPDPEGRLWSLADLASREAPHVPVSISYRGKLAHFRSIDQIAEDLAEEKEYVELVKRIDARLLAAVPEGTA